MDQRDERQESERAESLRRCQILESEPEPAFDRLTRLAASLFETPIAAITFTAEGRVWSKSATGLEHSEHIGISGFFSHIIEYSKTLIVEDASADQCFASDPLVISAPHIRFYVGAPLMLSNGQQIGTLSIADSRPRGGFSATDIEQFQDLAALVVDQLELRLECFGSRRIPKKSSSILAAMSHEIRTPMNGVIGMAELLLIADDLSERHRSRVEIIKRSGETLLTVLDHIIELANMETEEPTQDTSSFDLLEIVHEVHNQIQSKGIGEAIEFDLTESHLNVVGDAPRLKKLLLYFLNSAIAISTMGSIRLVMATQRAAEGKTQVRFEVKNANIAADVIERMLATFERNDRISIDSFNEANLGLLICKRLSLMMGGDIGVDQLASEDPILWLEISLSLQPGHATSKGTSTAAATVEIYSEAKTIWDVLVAEDNPDMALLIEDLLAEAGFHATVAPDGASVLKILDEQHVDVVLMDGRMPDMSGFETADLIRRLPDERARVPIIALTAEAMAGDRERYLSAGMDDYIAKPVDYETLIGAIERCCSEQQRRTST